MGRKPAYGASIRERAEKFADVVAKLESDDEFATLCGQLWETESALFGSKSLATQKLYTTQYRNAIRERAGDDSPALGIVKMSAGATDAINAAYTAKIAYDNRNLVKIDRWRDLVAVAHDRLRSRDPLSIIAALALLTGRRSYELMCLAGFAYRTFGVEHGSGRMKYEVEFTGQAKTRGRAGTQFENTYPIPVLAPASDILTAYLAFLSSPIGQKMRDASNFSFNSQYAAKLNAVVMRDYGHLWPAGTGLAIKCFRSLYAEIAYKMMAPKGLSKNAYFASVLGHKEDDLTTALSYFDYYLEDEDRFETIKLRESIQDALRHDKDARDKTVTPPWRTAAAEPEIEQEEPSAAPAVKRKRGRPAGRMYTTDTRRAVLAYIRAREPITGDAVPTNIASAKTVERLIKEGHLQRIAWPGRPKRSRRTQIILTEHGRNTLDDMRFEEEHPPGAIEQKPAPDSLAPDPVAQPGVILAAPEREPTPPAAPAQSETIVRPKRPRVRVSKQKGLFDESPVPEPESEKPRRKKEALPHEKRMQRRAQARKGGRRRR